MPENRTNLEEASLDILIFCIVRLYGIISLFYGCLAYRNSVAFQTLEGIYIRMHRELVRISKNISTDDADVNEFLSLLSESGILENKTMGGYKELVLFSMIDEEIEGRLNPLMDGLKYLCIVKRIYALGSDSFYAFSQSGVIKKMSKQAMLETMDDIEDAEGSQEESKQVVIEALCQAMSLDLIVNELVTTFSKELEDCKEELLSGKRSKEVKTEIEESLLYKKKSEKLFYGEKEILFKNGKGRNSMIAFFGLIGKSSDSIHLDEISDEIGENSNSKEEQKRIRDSIREAIKDTINPNIKKQTDDKIIDLFVVNESYVSIRYPVSLI